MLHCVFTIQSQISFRHHILTPFTLRYLPHPLPSGNHHAIVCVYEFLFVFLLCSFVALCFISHKWVKTCDSWLFLSGLHRLEWHSQDASMLLQMAVFHLFLRLRSVPLYMCHIPYLSYHNNAAIGCKYLYE